MLQGNMAQKRQNLGAQSFSVAANPSMGVFNPAMMPHLNQMPQYQQAEYDDEEDEDDEDDEEEEDGEEEQPKYRGIPMGGLAMRRHLKAERKKAFGVPPQDDKSDSENNADSGSNSSGEKNIQAAVRVVKRR